MTISVYPPSLEIFIAMECDTNMKATTKIDFDTNIFVLQLEGSPFGVD